MVEVGEGIRIRGKLLVMTTQHVLKREVIKCDKIDMNERHTPAASYMDELAFSRIHIIRTTHLTEADKIDNIKRTSGKR